MAASISESFSELEDRRRGCADVGRFCNAPPGMRPLRTLVERGLLRLGYVLTPERDLNWRRSRFFSRGERRLPYFFHRHNCGWPPARCTERVVELALADDWLRGHSSGVLEVGAVTPYYWPHRVEQVVDPADPHPLVTHRRSIFDVDLTGRWVLSISTLEHIGSGEYGQPEDGDAAPRALEKIVEEARGFLVSLPLGSAPRLESAIEGLRDTSEVEVTYYRRVSNWAWREESQPPRTSVPSGAAVYADAIAVLLSPHSA